MLYNDVKVTDIFKKLSLYSSQFTGTEGGYAGARFCSCCLTHRHVFQHVSMLLFSYVPSGDRNGKASAQLQQYLPLYSDL